MVELFRQSCRFIKSAPSIEALPPGNYPEVALIGRSNVGKSSLINAVTGKKAMARASVTPGRTQMLNFFLIGEALMLADLPGYGFAKAPKPLVAEWNRLVRDYLRTRRNLCRALLLVDARRGVMASDETMMALLDEAALSFQLVLTKADAVAPSALAGVAQRAHAAAILHPAAHPHVLVTSARRAAGVEEVRETLAMLVNSR